MSRPTRRTFLAGAAATAAASTLLQPTLSAAPRRFGARVRVGLVGCGRQGRAILGELAKLEDIEVTALCDVVEGRLRSAGRRAPGAASVETHGELVAREDVDAVIVATPTHLHRAVAEAALAAGKHVYCEAPLAHTAEDARAIALAARGAGTVFATGLQGRTNPVYDLARSFVVSGAIRDVVGMRAQYRRKTSWRFPAADPADEAALNWRLDPALSLGLAGELGTQQFDVAHWFLGTYPVRVRGRGAVLAWKDGREVADTIHCELEFPGGAQLTYEATLANSFEGEYELFVGTMGAVKLTWTHGWMFKEADAPTQGWEVYANRQRFHNDEGVTLIADATKLAEQGKLKEGVGLPHPSLYYTLVDFLASVADGAPVACTAEEGLRATLIGIHANEAVVSGHEVEIDPESLKVG